MRKLVVSMNLTLDGFMSGPNCELDWHFKYWNSEMAEYASEQLCRADTILLGRVTYQAMAKYWPGKLEDPSFPVEDVFFAQMMNSCQKVVCSRTIIETQWSNSILLNGNIRSEVTRLKRLPGKDIIIYGSGMLVSSLMRFGLIDEYVLWVHPVILEKGKPFFKHYHEDLNLKLVKSKIFESGVVLLDYKTVGQLVAV